MEGEGWIWFGLSASRFGLCPHFHVLEPFSLVFSAYPHTLHFLVLFVPFLIFSYVFRGDEDVVILEGGTCDRVTLP